MKYYIVLSSLNVDNVLSSESISPISFYGKKDFGYRSFQKVDGVTIINDIVLFSQLPYFEITDSERENYPMAIEIEDDAQLNKKIRNVKTKNSDCDIFLCNQTIYLNPWNCKVLFFSQQAMVLAKLKCEDSLCNKLSYFLRFEVIVPDKSILLSDVLKGVSFDESGFNLDRFVIDNKINKIKGFLYGYYLGFSKSLSEDAAQLLGLQKRIYNIVASIINNKGESNDQFNEELRKLDAQYNEIDPHKKELRYLWNEKILSRFSLADDKSIFETLLRELSVEGDAKINFCRSHNISVRKMTFFSSNRYFDWATYQSELSSYTQNIIYEDKVKRPDIDIRKEFTIKEDYSTIILNNGGAKLYNDILSNFFVRDTVITIEDLRLNKLEIATEITKGIKSIMSSNNKVWDNSPERVYLNSLRQNIANSEPFSLQPAPDIIILSIAAFLLKGEDFDALIRYLEENGVSNYKYVLGFWGITCGYVDIPKPIFKPIQKNKETFCKIYKSISGLLFDDSLEGSFPEITETYINKPLVVETNKLEDKKILHSENKQKLFEANLYVQKKLGKKVTEKQKLAIDKVIEVAITPDNFLSLLKQNGVKSNTNVYKEFEVFLSPIKESNNSGKLDFLPEISNQEILNRGNLSFLMDPIRWNHIYLLISDDKCLKQFKIDSEWFIENYKESYIDSKKGKQTGRYFGKPTDNKSVLERFENYLNNKRENKQKWLSDIYKKIPIERIIVLLRSIYK